IFLSPPLISLPITNPPCAAYTVQLRIITFSMGIPLFLPSASRPLFIHKASSPTSNTEFSINTFLQLSASIPSPFWAYHGFFTKTFLTVRCSLIKGCRHQAGEFWNVTPSSKIYLQLSLIHISEPTRQAEISYAVF